jgi:hypothetical protein
MDIFKKYPALSLGIFALVAGLIAYYIGTRTGRGLSASAAAAQLDGEILANPLTYELSQYDVFADRLQSSMITLADDEAAIYAVFSKMRNRSDVLQLIKTFGSRGSWVWNVAGGSLSNWMALKLSNNEIGRINEILSDSKIDFQF